MQSLSKSGSQSWSWNSIQNLVSIAKSELMSQLEIELIRWRYGCGIWFAVEVWIEVELLSKAIADWEISVQAEAKLES